MIRRILERVYSYTLPTRDSQIYLPDPIIIIIGVLTMTPDNYLPN